MASAPCLVAVVSAAAACDVTATGPVLFGYPLRGVIRQTEGLGWRRHPLLGIQRLHTGTDYAAAVGTPVFAAACGEIAFAGSLSEYGNVIFMRHASGYETRYAHLSAFAAGVRIGQRFERGDLIGLTGTTGLSTGPHLHFEIRQARALAGPSAGAKR